MADPIEFVGGDDIRQPIVLLVGTLIPNLAGGTLTAEVYARGALLFTLTEDDGITVDNVAPPPSESEDDQEPHATLEIGAEQSSDLPLGKTSYVKPRFLTAGGVQISFERIWLIRR